MRVGAGLLLVSDASMITQLSLNSNFGAFKLQLKLFELSLASKKPSAVAKFGYGVIHRLMG